MQQSDVQVTTDMRACASSWRKVTNMAFCSSWNIPARVFDKVSRFCLFPFGVSFGLKPS
ncbi:hypothetical protein RHGRI_007296 [Rhododendron griersonianum]|uniref:Uncharacterized protein n=1 Tax=Rhododendron griersonianum TaxID=479676 RepID=A0AAV6KXL5_9ERIC|nr:hypothetical protein RHGRI_007296 [Rhododendron griersonianum]